jgi:hypothetical protein
MYVSKVTLNSWNGQRSIPDVHSDIFHVVVSRKVLLTFFQET